MPNPDFHDPIAPVDPFYHTEDRSPRGSGGDSESFEEDQPEGTGEIGLSQLLQSQLRLAERLQNKLLNGGINELPPREMKELVNSVSTLLTLAHRTGQAEKEIQTYKLFVVTVMDFLRRRSDSLGIDLASELREVAKEYAGSHVDMIH